MNKLARERSPYLRHAADQKIEWYPWSEEAFERARGEDRPVFLSSGAVWCHWCHVMAKECFFDDEVVRLLNDHFICIKLDRDERPDIDRRYQQAVAAMGSGGGWPLSVFLTPDKRPFFGGTYFPPEDSYGRPGFKRVLRAVVELYRKNREEVARYTAQLMDFLKPEGLPRGPITVELRDGAVGAVMSAFDPRNGGFGTAPKFPLHGAMTFLLNRHFFDRDEGSALAVRKTLDAMAKGGFHDQLKGGFHRYSVDEAWVVPHFEKMADDNAWLLRVYADAYGLFGAPYYRQVAEGIITFAMSVLSDPEGGFYASQDADVTPDDEGGYFTWTDEEFRAVLGKDEYDVLSRHLLHERGSMHHDPSKRVLFAARDESAIAREMGKSEEAVKELIARGKAKLLNERDRRTAPFIDETLYTSLNGMFITSFLSASRMLGHDGARAFALKSLDRILRLNRQEERLLHTAGVEALLDDYVYIVEALIAAYEATGSAACRDEAERLMEQCLAKFWDGSEGGFFDAETEVLGIRLKGIEDIPHPSPNAAAVMQLLKLSVLTGRALYRQRAEEALSAFAVRARDLGAHGGYYFCSLDAYFSLLTLTVEASPQSPLADAARSLFRPYTAIVYAEDRQRIIPCLGDTCYEPLSEPSGLREFIDSTVKAS